MCVGGWEGGRGWLGEREGRFGLFVCFAFEWTGERKLVAVVRPIVYMFYIRFTVQ